MTNDEKFETCDNVVRKVLAENATLLEKKQSQPCLESKLAHADLGCSRAREKKPW